MDSNACPLCGSKMVSRQTRSTGQRFWGCSQYPKCKGTRDTDGRLADERDDDRRRDAELATRKSRRYEGM